LGAAEEVSRPRVGTTGTTGPQNLIRVISLNGDVQVLARSVVVFDAQFAAVARISAQEVLHEARTVPCQVSVRGVRKVEEFAAWQLADAFTSEVCGASPQLFA
jgi:hypothetical protein